LPPECNEEMLRVVFQPYVRRKVQKFNRFKTI
jgi:hypothetical protein